MISRPTIRAFNWMYLHRKWRKIARSVMPFDKFFFPLDRLNNWNLLHGRRGFLQYQFVVPEESKDAVREIIQLTVEFKAPCALSVLKIFGSLPSPGMMSFPRPGVTLALDFPFRGMSTLELCERFDEVVRKSGGAVYPAKDARMSPQSYKNYFPRWQVFASFIDPKFCSDFWQRVTASEVVKE